MMIKPILQVDLQNPSCRVYFCGVCGDFLNGEICQGCHEEYSTFQISHSEIEFINQGK